MISMIVACGLNNEIGKDNELLWKLPKDMKHFKEETIDNIVVMGENTFLSINSKPLKDRLNIVVTDSIDTKCSGGNLLFVDNLSFVMELSKYAHIYVIGGASIYEQLLDVTDELIITTVYEKFPDADTFFPKLNYSEWNLERAEFHEADDKNKYDMSIMWLSKL